MNLGAGLSAATGFFQAQEHAQDRDYLAKQRDYQDKTMQAGLSTLGDRTAADAARLKLAAAQSGAGLSTLPGQTVNALRQQELDKGGLDFKQQQQPVEQANTAKQTLIAGAGLDRGIADIPEKERSRVAANTEASAVRRTQALVTLGQLVSSNDKPGAIAHLNAAADAESVRTGTTGKKFVDIVPSGQKTADGDQRGYDLIAEDGTKLTIPYTAISQAMASAKTGKYSMKQGRAGDVQVLNENTGEVQTKIAADPNYARSAGSNQHTPAQLQLVNAYMEAPENKGMTFSQAMDRVKTSMEKPRHQAILELVGKNLMPGSDPQKEYEKWAGLFDHARQSAPGLPSNSPLAPTIDPKYQNLFTP